MKKTQLVQLLIRWAFIVVPTAVIGYITLVYLNLSYTAFNATVVTQAVYFGLGLTVAYGLYFFRARWLVTFILLWLVYWILGKIVAGLPGEFDVFYATAKFQLYSALFIFGWVFGFLLVRVKYSYIFLFGILGVATVATTSNTVDVSLRYILLHLVPVAAYGLYMLFMTPVLSVRQDIDLKKSGRLAFRFALFLLLVVLAFVFVESLFRQDLKAVEKELAARGAKDKDGPEKAEGDYDDRFGLMDKPSKDDGFRLKDTMRVNSRMSQSDQLMFCSKLDNYFPDGSPMPLYYVYHYLTKYDPLTESFIRDVDVPYFDELNTDPSELPMYHSRTDSTVIHNSLANRKRMVVNSDIYMSSNIWKHSLLAPASAFHIQTIPVEKDFQKQFFSAYRVKSYASDLNNAYFVYNPSAHPSLEMYQEERHEELRKVSDYSRVDSAFYAYYTQLPTGVLYDTIARITEQLSSGLTKPVDKVLAVRDFFLQRDENGKRVFRYTLRPGGPSESRNIPSATMLGNFLFKTHAGYCTYYAGASLFLLRSMGIPSRFTTGFATVNRSDKNKGWYWFYASQAHAWTQVYFPGYGWMDFDMTIGNEDQHGAPRPDGTPPLPPPEPWLVLNAVAASIPDTDAKRLDVSFSNLIYFNDQHQLSRPFDVTLDVSLCRVLYDKKDTTLSIIHPGDSIIVVSYKDEAKEIPQPRAGVKIEVQLKGFPSPIVADEIHIKAKEVPEKKEETAGVIDKPIEEPFPWREVIRYSAAGLGGLALLILLFPLLFLAFLIVRKLLTTDQVRKADLAYASALYRFHMAGIERENETPLDYAKAKADPFFETNFAEFMNLYLRLKYGKGSMIAGDKEVIDRFSAAVGPAVRKKTGSLRTFFRYFNLVLASRYFFRPDNSHENQTL